MGILPRFSFYGNSQGKVIIFLIAGMVVYIFLQYLFREKSKKMFYGRLSLRHKGICLEGKYFMDSGNGLVESLSNKPVLLAGAGWFFEKFPKQELMSRPVIYKSVGKSKGLLDAYCVEELIIYEGQKTYTYEKVWVGLCTEDIFSGKDYQIILPPFYGVKGE